MSDTSAVECYLCGAPQTAPVRGRLRHGVERRVFVCPSCGLDFLEPKDKDLRTYYAEDYRKDYSPRPEEAAASAGIFEIYRPLQEERVERLRPYLPGAGILLDIGCSAGHFLDAVKALVGEAVGIEFNLANVAFVKEKLGFRAYSVPIEETDLAEDSIDLITCFHAMEHMPDPRGFLETLRRYLKPRGRVYIEVPNVEDALLSAYRSDAYADFWYREPHLFNFSPATLEKLMGQAGFKGKILPVQRYSLLNHLSWALTGRPQASADVAMRSPALIANESGPEAVRGRLNEWFARTDAEYRDLVKSLGVSESIGFLGEAA